MTAPWGTEGLSGTVRRLAATSVPEVVDVLRESFFNYPVMRFVLGPAAPDYAEQVRTLVHFFVMARVFRDEVMLGAKVGERLIATALVSRPGGSDAPQEFYDLRREVWGSLGRAAEERYTAFGDACAPFQVEVPHLHLNMIGVRGEAQGTGLARHLLEAVHQLSQADSQSAGVTLTTENPDNVGLYKYFGYELVGEAEVGPGLRTWGFYRPDSARARSG